jgi:beta-aspartyl-dipeptidase (metallo-type)
MILLKNANLYAPAPLGRQDILLSFGKIIAIRPHIDEDISLMEVFDLEGKIILPGFIDQHIHLTGAGGGYSYESRTSEVSLGELVTCGSTTVVGLLGTDGTTRSLQELFAKTKMLKARGINAFMYTNYYGYPPMTITGSVTDDLVFIEPVIGCKIAISDHRSSYPTMNELARLASQVNIGGMISGKGGILHLHLGNFEGGMDPIFELVQKYHVPIRLLSPTHVGRNESLFNQAIEFAKLGGMIDITTGASKFVEPWEQVIIALEKGVSIDNITFSTDGHAGLGQHTTGGNGSISSAPVHTNLKQVVDLIQEGGLPVHEAFKLITENPAKNLSLLNKGSLKVGNDGDICVFGENWELEMVIANDHILMNRTQVVSLSS